MSLYYTQKEIDLKKEPVNKVGELTLPEFRISWQRQNYGDNKNISGFQGLGRGRNDQVEHRGFLEQWNYSV